MSIMLGALVLAGCQHTEPGPGYVSLTPAAQSPAVRYRYRDERTGRFVSAAYAAQHRRTTTREIVR